MNTVRNTVDPLSLLNNARIIITWATCGSTSLGFGSVYFYFFVDVTKSQLLHHPIGLCETERYKYANLHGCFFLFFLRFPDRLIKLFEVKCSFLDKFTLHGHSYWSVMSLASIVVLYTLTMLTIAHADRCRPTLKDDERFRNGLVRDLVF